MKASKCTSGAISIRKNGNYGILEIKTPSYNWGGICDDLSGNEEGLVICKMLGYSSVQTVWIGKGQEFSGSDGDNILLDNLVCTGSEKCILDCEHLPWGQENCAASEWLGVTCS